MTEALLFDLDGTLLNSDPLHKAVFVDFLADYGINVDDAYYNEQILGARNTELFARILPGQDPKSLDEAKEREFRRRIAMTGAVPTPGLLRLLDRAHAARLRMAVVTNASRANLAAMLAALGIADRFDALVSADDCQRAKPHPEPYERAARALGVAPGRAIAFEDSATGLASAAAAGCVTVGLTTSFSGDRLRAAGARHVIRDFNDTALEAILGATAGVST